MLCHLPSLQTVACGFSEALSALTASPALVVSYLQHAQDSGQLLARPCIPLSPWALSLLCCDSYSVLMSLRSIFCSSPEPVDASYKPGTETWNMP